MDGTKHTLCLGFSFLRGRRSRSSNCRDGWLTIGSINNFEEKVADLRRGEEYTVDDSLPDTSGAETVVAAADDDVDMDLDSDGNITFDVDGDVDVADANFVSDAFESFERNNLTDSEPR